MCCGTWTSLEKPTLTRQVPEQQDATQKTGHYPFIFASRLTDTN